MGKRIQYGESYDEYVKVDSLSDELRFVECMKLYKTHETLEDLENALKRKAKEKIKKVF